MAAATQAQALDLRRAVPEDAYLVIHGRHNPERDYQRRYWREVWETDYVGDTRTLQVHISWLRRKIEENPRRPTRLRTVRGVGYRFGSRH